MSEQTAKGYLFNGRFYKKEEDLRGKTMSEDNQPEPLYSESQLKQAVIKSHVDGLFEELDNYYDGTRQGERYYEANFNTKEL